MKTSLLLAAAAALLAGSISPAAQAADSKAKADTKAPPAAPPAAAAKPSEEELALMRSGAMILRSFSLVFESKDVSQGVKGQLTLCLYNNKLRDVTVAAKQVIAKNPQLKEDNVGDLYRAAAAVCGVRFKKPDEGAAGNAPAAKPDGKSASKQGGDSR